MKTLGILILAVGVGICAAFGARLSDGMYERTRLQGQVTVLEGQIGAAWTTYCAARAEAKLPHGECPAPEGEKADEKATEEADEKAAAEEKPEEKAAEEKAAEGPAPKLPTYEAALAEQQAALAALASTEALPEAVAGKRGAWLELKKATAEPEAKLASTPLPGPQARLAGWFDLSGMPFLGGLVLIVIGAVLGRKAAKAELSDDSKAGTGERVDFGVAVDKLAELVQALADEAAAMDSPSEADRQAVQHRIEDLQLTRFGPIVEARYQLQNRIGLAGFANVFGPLSGGERWINRSWSTLADNHWPETQASLVRSAEQLAIAAATLRDELAKA